MDASPLGQNYSYPSMDGLAQIVDTVVNHYGLKKFTGLGVGIGANVFLRYAVKHQQNLVALILVNADCGTAGWLEWGYEKMNINLLYSKGMNSFTVNYLMWQVYWEEPRTLLFGLGTTSEKEKTNVIQTSSINIAPTSSIIQIHRTFPCLLRPI